MPSIKYKDGYLSIKYDFKSKIIQKTATIDTEIRVSKWGGGFIKT